MRVRMTIHRPLTDSAGREVQAHPGLEVDLSAEQAVRLIQAGQAEAVPVAAEAAVTSPKEATVLPKPATSRQKAEKS